MNPVALFGESARGGKRGLAAMCGNAKEALLISQLAECSGHR
jgi:hypothetical protein